MRSIGLGCATRALIDVSDKIIASEAYLTELDTVIGDGDHGFGMRVGFSAVKRELEAAPARDLHGLFSTAGMALIREMGGTSGVIYGTLFIGGLSCLEGKDVLTLRDLSDYFTAGANAIKRRGRVERGDKTMYDALANACESLETSANADDDIETAFRRAYQSAVEGAEATRSMLSKKGRSRNFREKTIGHPDTGAVSTSIFFGALADSFERQSAEQNP